MDKKLTANEVAITTATIEVKVLKLGNRQVTLAVFRQLESEGIVDLQTALLKGEPWGRINYHVDCDDDKHHHLHVVWQKGNELRRAVAWKSLDYLIEQKHTPKGYAKLYRDLNEAAVIWFYAALLDGWMPDELQQAEHYYRDQYQSVRFGSRVASFVLTNDMDAILYNRHWQLINPNRLSDPLPGYETALARIRNEVPLDVFGQPASPEHVRQTLIDPILESLQQYERRWKESYERLAALDQLFIAV